MASIQSFCEVQVTVRNTFLHLSLVSFPVGSDDLEEQQPLYSRSMTAPLPGMQHFDVSDIDGPDCKECYGCSAEQPVCVRIDTRDPFEEPWGHFTGLPRTHDTLLTLSEQDSESESDSSERYSEACPSSSIYSGERQQQQKQEPCQQFEPHKSPQACGRPGLPPSGVHGASSLIPAPYFIVPVCYMAPPSPSQDTVSCGVVNTPSSDASLADAVRPLSRDIVSSRLRSKVQQKVKHASGSGRTTVMLRNLPSEFTRELLLDWMHAEGFAGTFDFVYLPIDFKVHTPLGYAFVNFVSSNKAEAFFRHFQNFRHWGLGNGRPCSMSWSDPQQGLDANVARYRNSPLMHELVPDSYRPAIFRNGVRIPFPAPTRKIHPPRKGSERMLI